jgi:predicted Zn-dependent protease
MDRARELYEAGRALMDAGALVSAASTFEESVRLDPHFKTLELLGECLFRAGRPREAIVPLAAASPLNPGVRAPALLAEVFLELNSRHDAEAMATLALSRDPSNRRALAVRRAAALFGTDPV